MNNLFAYGTLMCNDIFLGVAGCLLSSVVGTLSGFSRHPVKGESYPAIIRQATGTVDGVVYLDLPELLWERLDSFEGALYKRSPVTVKSQTGTQLDAQVYVWSSTEGQLLEEGDWNYDEFLINHKLHFIRHYPGFTAET